MHEELKSEVHSVTCGQHRVRDNVAEMSLYRIEQ